MPPAVLVLGLSVFALGTSEFMIAGLLPPLAADLGVSIPDAGLLVSAFAAGMLVGAPLLAAATLRLPRKLTLLGMLGVFALGHVIGALAPGYGLLFATRVLCALACAGFWAVAAVTAISLVPADRRGRAMAVVAGGLTAANVLGVPLGTALGQSGGWRAAFWAVAALATLALAGVLAFVPRAGGAAQRPDLRAELRAYRRGALGLALGITALTCATTMATFSYLAPLLTDVTGLASRWVPVVLAVFGLGALIGIAVGGRLADSRPLATLAAGLIASLVVLAALALGASSAVLTVPAVFLLGLLGFLTNPSLNTRVFTLAGAAPTLAGATNVTAFNTGIVVAPWLGGLAIDAGLGYPSVAWVSAGFAVAALAAVAAARLLERRAVPEAAPAPVP
ncbi:Cmx/CmrA family chloramphenicol efflux MFS transporter [Prauserella muralis]|uniref:Chemotaxis protein n=1 Tax=Prauserella muralis TaxID=588067 RepID=A0A2V4APY0_9PSEU|nr:Cmx/CmrA family chloramphenicol efflux MFS transporter [Prauserella muralis]PXY22409.1 chemotaxis protein [Prauserella muralis]TWE28073.1 DHA1 family chloramphenicol resistance protein-like MFS transporter [Prauserella muralis]